MGMIDNNVGLSANLERFAKGNQVELYGLTFELVGRPLVISDDVVLVDATEQKFGTSRRPSYPANKRERGKGRVQSVSSFRNWSRACNWHSRWDFAVSVVDCMTAPDPCNRDMCGVKIARNAFQPMRSSPVQDTTVGKLSLLGFDPQNSSHKPNRTIEDTQVAICTISVVATNLISDEKVDQVTNEQNLVRRAQRGDERRVFCTFSVV
jgi:hypothetical protein